MGVQLLQSPAASHGYFLSDKMVSFTYTTCHKMLFLLTIRTVDCFYLIECSFFFFSFWTVFCFHTKHTGFHCARQWKREVLVTQSCPILCEPMDWTQARQAPLSMGFSRQEYWSGLPYPSSGGFPNPGIEWVSLTAGRFFTVWAIGALFLLIPLNLEAN